MAKGTPGCYRRLPPPTLPSSVFFGSRTNQLNAATIRLWSGDLLVGQVPRELGRRLISFRCEAPPASCRRGNTGAAGHLWGVAPEWNSAHICVLCRSGPLQSRPLNLHRSHQTMPWQWCVFPTVGPLSDDTGAFSLYNAAGADSPKVGIQST